MESVQPLSGAHRVYNLEVQTRHCYHVGQTGVLSHNGQGCLRRNMGDPPDNSGKWQAHHDYPYAYRDEFSAHGINVDAPSNGRWVGPNHQKWSRKYNQKWRAFLDSEPSRPQILRFRNRIRQNPEYQ